MVEGVLLTPPERTSLLGRTLWKTRWVTFGLEPDHITPPPTRASPLNQNSVSLEGPDGRLDSPLKSLKTSSHNGSLVNLSEAGAESMWLSIYKTRGDAQPLGRFPISSMRKCDVETMSYRKSSPAHPTLIVHFESPLRADNQPPPVKPAKKSEKKLRPGRASIKKAAVAAAASAEYVGSPAATTHTSLGTRSQASSPFPRSSAPKTITEAVLFRSPVEGIDAILDWHDTLRPHLMIARPHTSQCHREQLPRSHDSYVSASSGKENSQVLSPAASARSSVSSPYSNNSASKALPIVDPSADPSKSALVSTDARKAPIQPTFVNRETQYSASVYSDHPSRTNSLPIGTSVAALHQPGPPARETILDRAFQMNYIPGADLHHVSFMSDRKSDISSNRENTMNSIARFEALMQEMDARKANEHRKSSCALPAFIDQPKAPSTAQKALGFITSGVGNSARLRQRPPKGSRPVSLAVTASSARTSVFTISSPTSIEDQDPRGAFRRRSSVSITPSTSSTLASRTTTSTFANNTALPRRDQQRFSISDYAHPSPTPSPSGTTYPMSLANPHQRQSSLSFSSSKLFRSHHTSHSPHYPPPNAPHNSAYTGPGTGLGSVYGARESVSSVSSLSSFGSVGSDSESLEFGCSGDRGMTTQDRRWARGGELGGAWRVSGGAFGV